MALHSAAKFNETEPAGFDGVFHWDWISTVLQRVTGRRITPMDIDCHVEINGQFLMWETKRRGMPIPDGQRKALLNLWARGYVTLVFLWGKEVPFEAEIWYPSGRRATIRERIEDARVVKHEYWVREQLELQVAGWALFAENTPCPFAYDGAIAGLNYTRA